MKSYLFVCSAGEKRSPTATSVALELASERRIKLEATFGAIDIDFPLPRDKMAKHFAQYDMIFAMEPYMVKRLEEKCGVESSKIICLNIKDIYEKNDPVLRQMLRKKLSEYIRQAQ